MTNSAKKPFNIMDLKPQSKDKRETPGGNAPQKKPTKARYITFDGHTKIVSSEGNTSTLKDLHGQMGVGGKQTIHCPSPEHVDESPSAFIDKKQSGDLFIFCASCGQKGFYRSPPKKGAEKLANLPIPGDPVIDLKNAAGGKKSDLQLLTEIGSHLELFHDSVYEPYAVIERLSTQHVIPIESKLFSDYLVRTIYN